MIRIRPRDWGWTLVVFAIALLYFRLGLSFNPSNQCDIFNYWEYLETYKDISILESMGKTFPFSYSFNLWFWITAQLNNQYLLSAVSCFIVYGIYTYIITDYCIKTNKSFIDWFTCAFFVIGNISFVQVASSMRNFIAIAFAAMAIYMFKKNRVAVATFWILALFMHSSVFLIIMCYYIYTNRKYLKKKALFRATIILLIILGSFFLFYYGRDRVFYIINKYIGYFSGNESFSDSLYYYVKYLYTFSLLIFSYIIRANERYDERNSNIISGYTVFSILLLLSSIVSSQVYSRFFQGFLAFSAIEIRFNSKVREKNVLTILMLGMGIFGILFDLYLLFHII